MKEEKEVKNKGSKQRALKNKPVKRWLISMCVILTFLFVAIMVVSMNQFIYGTINIFLGGYRRTLRGPRHLIEQYTTFHVQQDGDSGFIGDGRGFDTGHNDATGNTPRSARGITSKDHSYEQGNILSRQIVEEGMVLLRNDIIGGESGAGGRALPLATGARVSVFGRNSVDLVLGGSGSSAGDGAGDAGKMVRSLEQAGLRVNRTLHNFYNSRASGPGRAANPPIGALNVTGLATGETPWRDYTLAVRRSFDGSLEGANPVLYNDAAVVVISRIGGEGWDLPRTQRVSHTGGPVRGGRVNDHYLQLDRNEEDLLREVSELFDNVIVLLNVSTTFQTDFIVNNAIRGVPLPNNGITGAFWMGSPGGEGAYGIGRVLVGAAQGGVNPSGRLFNAFPMDLTTCPTWKNVGDNRELLGNSYLIGGTAPTGTRTARFVEYQEDIYLGYRYWETRAFEEFSERGDNSWHENYVAFPFGFGLSYNMGTNENENRVMFDWQIEEVRTGNFMRERDVLPRPDGARGPGLGERAWGRGDALPTAPISFMPEVGERDGVPHINDAFFEIDVRVINNGNAPAKDTVQLYFSPPFYGGVEKPHVALGDFAKTRIIPAAGPGVTNNYDVVTLRINGYDMASWDWDNSAADGFGRTGWVLEDGDYNLYIGRNSHSAWFPFAGAGEGDFAFIEANGADDTGAQLNQGSLRVVFRLEGDNFYYEIDPVTGHEVVNRFSAGDGGIQDVSNHILNEGRRYMSRLDFAGTFPVSLTVEDRDVDTGFLDSLYWRNQYGARGPDGGLLPGLRAVDENPNNPWYAHAHNHWWLVENQDGTRQAFRQNHNPRLEYFYERPVGSEDRGGRLTADGRFLDPATAPENTEWARLLDSEGNPTTRQIKLYDLIIREPGQPARVVDHGDVRWQHLLDRLTMTEMANLVGTGAFQNMQIPRIGKPRAIDLDSPSGFVLFMSAFPPRSVTYASQATIGATWNQDLAHDMGVMIGIEALYGNGTSPPHAEPFSGWYAPGLNLHRSAFSGRNFEYYSECPILSGKLAAATMRGAASKGVYSFVKHFVFNDQETDRDNNGLITWLSEQAMRELYLRAFEIAIKEGRASAIMSAFNRVGVVWTGGSYELQQEILRYEWGFQGMVISDYNLPDKIHQPVDQMMRTGGDLNLVQGDNPQAITTPVNVWGLRRAVHNILFTVAGSNAMNGFGPGTRITYAIPMWQLIFILVIVFFVVLFAVLGFFLIARAKGALMFKKSAARKRQQKKEWFNEGDEVAENVDDGGGEGIVDSDESPPAEAEASSEE